MIRGDLVTQYLPFIPPSIISLINEHKVYAGLFLFFGGNLLNGIITNSGALEIFYNDELIWSTLKTGKVPNMKSLVHLIKAKGGRLR